MSTSGTGTDAVDEILTEEQIIRVDAKENVRKQIVRELQVGHDCNSPYVITFYGAFQNEARDIVLCMEYMDCGYVPFPLILYSG